MLFYLICYILTEGVGVDNKDVLVLGATNIPWTLLLEEGILYMTLGYYFAFLYNYCHKAYLCL